MNYHITNRKSNNGLIDDLSSSRELVRTRARKRIVAKGPTMVSSLVQTLKSSKEGRVRWEAAKALAEIGDSEAIPALVQALEDNDRYVAWLASLGLKKLEKTAWPQLFLVLSQRGTESGLLRQNARQVLLDQQTDGPNDPVTILLDALENNSSAEVATAAAQAALNKIKEKTGPWSKMNWL
jgi:HEAT repeat protein